jgi:TorA maturation chaperone TorD
VTPASQPVTGRARDEFSDLRAGHYRLLSLLLATEPTRDTLNLVAGLSGDSTALGQAYAALARTAAEADSDAVAREFFELFVGVGRGELLPYASFYITGFLNERPLAMLRADLAALGVTRAPGHHDPEDHIAFLCEVMADMAAGRVASQGAVTEQALFQRHLAPWAAQFFDDLAIAPSARFYRPLAEVGRIWIDIDARAFALAA